MYVENDPKSAESINIKMVDYLEKLLENPQHAIAAVKSRNLKIRSLKAEIEHRKIAEKEIFERLENLILLKNQLENTIIDISEKLQKATDKTIKLEFEKEKLKSYLNEFENKFIILDTQVKTKELLKLESWTYKLKEALDKMPKWAFIAPIISFLLTPPMSKYILVLLFVLLFVASLIGWPALILQIEPIFRLFGGN